MTYDSVAAWRERGKVYEQTKRFGPDYRIQENTLLDVLAPLRFSTVLEVGCGFGRIGSRLVAARPSIAYTGIDISPEMLESARKRMPKGLFVEASIADYAKTCTLQYELVLVVEVLMHQPPERMPAIVRALKKLSSRYIVSLDWDEPPDGVERLGNFLHDYRVLYGPPVRAIRVPGRRRSRQAIWVHG